MSNLGNVKSLKYRRTGKERILKPRNNGCGYLYVVLCKNGNRRLFKIHRLVAKAFIPNPKNKREVNHKDENKTNNFVDNLEWVTSKENINYGTRNERIAKSISKSVLQFTKNGEFVKEWSSTHQIQRDLGFYQSSITKCCNGKLKTAYGFIWKYA